METPKTPRDVPQSIRAMLVAMTGQDPNADPNDTFHKRVGLGDRVALAEEVRLMLDAPHSFAAGDIVRQRFPNSKPVHPALAAGEFGIVVRTFERVDVLAVLLDDITALGATDAQSATTFFDLVIGCFCNRGHFHTFVTDSRLFEPHPDFPRGEGAA